MHTAVACSFWPLFKVEWGLTRCLILHTFNHLADHIRVDQLAWLFDLFPILKSRQSQTAKTLSGGEQQMLAIGRALMMQPRLLILDEPTLGLAPVILEQLSKALEAMQKSTPITVLLGEQNVTFALPHADRVYVLEHARIIWEGSPSRFEREMGHGFLEAVPSGEPNALRACVSGRGVSCIRPQ